MFIMKNRGDYWFYFRIICFEFYLNAENGVNKL